MISVFASNQKNSGAPSGPTLAVSGEDDQLALTGALGIGTLPLLTFFADIMGLIGGAAISQLLLNVSPTQYLARLPHVVDGSDLFVGLFKAPVFAFFIAVVSCMHGLRVSGSAESVGQETTRAVVKSTFVVLALAT